MRVLIVSEAYRDDSLSANGTFGDIVTWIDYWTEFDDSLHIYVLVPEKKHVPWEDEFMRVDNPQVTLLPATRAEDDNTLPGARGLHTSELRTLAREVRSNYGYWDIVIDQREIGRSVLIPFLNELVESSKASVQPFELIDYVHDIATPSKHHGQWYPNEAMVKWEHANFTHADRIWTKGGADYDDMMENSRGLFQYDVVDEIDNKAEIMHAPVDFSAMEEEYADEPSYIHIAGDPGTPKRNPETILDLIEFLYSRFNIKTIVTAPQEIPDEFTEPSFVEAYPNCTGSQYRKMLKKGDFYVYASEFDASPRTMCEQAGNGQVAIYLDRPWLRHQVPDDYKLMSSDKKMLKKLAAWSVKNWSQAITEHKKMLAYMKSKRDASTAAKEPYNDMKSMVDARVDDYSVGSWGEREILEGAIESVGTPATLEEIDEASTEFTNKGNKLSELWTYNWANVPFALRAMGYVDTGDSRIPAFTEAES